MGWDLKVIGANFKGKRKGKVGLDFIIITIIVIPKYYFLGGVGRLYFFLSSPFLKGHAML